VTDAKNKKILYELSKNSRISNKVLAKQIGLSQASTVHRLQNLQASGMILNTHVITDNSKLGFKTFRLYVSLTDTTPEKEQEIIKWLSLREDVPVLATSSGHFDILLVFWMKSENEFHTFYEEFKKVWGQFIHKSEFFIYLKTLHFARSYLVNKDPEFLFSTGMSEQVSYDEKDLSILRSLNTDARTSALSISKSIGLSVKPTIDRIKRLKSAGIIKGFGLNTDIQKLGLYSQKINIVLKNSMTESEKIELAKTIPGVTFIDVTIGEYDLELSLDISSQKEFEAVLGKIKKETGGFKRYITFQIQKYSKLQFI
jgi:Lrp/AsnC family leucine-responsive transcriptional regulator